MKNDLKPNEQNDPEINIRDRPKNSILMTVMGSHGWKSLMIFPIINTSIQQGTSISTFLF
jgi:hypothetical protein